MRISTSYQYGSYLKNIEGSYASYFKAQQQLSTGKRFTNAAEDPMAAGLSLDARRLKGRFEQFETNLRSAKDYLGNTERALAELTTLATQAYTTALQGASDSLDQNARQSLADNVKDLKERLVNLANTQGSNGQYIFGGHISDSKPFEDQNGTLVYHGNSGAILVETGPSGTMRVNLDSADTLFGDLFEGLSRLETNLLSGNVATLSSENVDELKGMTDQIIRIRGQVGNRMQTVEQYSAQNQRRIDDLKVQISELEEIDFSETYVRYQAAQVAYQASLQVASQGMGMSLMDFIR